MAETPTVVITETDTKITETKTFADSRLEYGLRWAREIKKNVNAFPTPEEMLIGIYQWLCDQLNGYIYTLKTKEQ